MHLCLFEDEGIEHLRPLVDLRPSYDLRTGMRTNLERAREVFPDTGILLHLRPHLEDVARERYDAPTNRIPADLNVLFLNGRLLLDDSPVIDRILRMSDDREGRILVSGDTVVAAWVPEARVDFADGQYVSAETFDGLPVEEVEGHRMIDRMWNLLDHFHHMIEVDYTRATRRYNVLDRPGAEIHGSVVMIEPERVFVERGARILPGVVINADSGPVYIDRNAIVMEHAVLRGPLYLGPDSQAKIAVQIDGGSFGECVKVGGEVHDTIIHSFSNKAHLGFLGDAYLGCWVNIGASSNNSNLKNDYGETSLYNVATGEYENTGRQFLGLFMGDHAKCAIGTLFNTSSVIGTYCNLFGEGFQPHFVPAFTWGGNSDGFSNYRIEKALDVARAMMKRRNITLSEAEETLLRNEFDRVARQREEITVL